MHFFALLCFYFRANASKAKHCRSKSLRCTTFPSQITSALFSAIPSPCPSVLLSAFASHSFALPSLFIAVQCCSVALPCYALPLHSSSPHSLCHAPHCFATPLPRLASHGQSNSALPLLGSSATSGALPLPSLSSPPRIRAVNAMPLLSGLHLIGSVGKAVLSLLRHWPMPRRMP